MHFSDIHFVILFTGAKSTSAFRIEIHTQCQQVRQHQTCFVNMQQLLNKNYFLVAMIDNFFFAQVKTIV